MKMIKRLPSGCRFFFFVSGELSREATSSILELVQSEGTRKVKRQVEMYYLFDATCSLSQS